MHRARIRALGGIRNAAIAWILAAAAAGLARPAGAQSADAAPLFTPAELEELVAPIALYPDDLVAIVLPASTYPLDVVEAARFLDELEDDAGLEPDTEWDDSIVALLNYPEVLRLLDEDLDWTWDLGEAFLNQQTEVFDAIQRFRVQAREAGNLESDERVIVSENEGAIRIAPSDPKVIYVPYYEPREVIVHHHYAPIRYYPRPYPVYYYPYPAGHSFWSGYFWGVTTAFTIGWHTHHLHAHHHLHVGHPYHRHRYYDPYYVRRSISINIVNIDRNVYVWQPRQQRIGVRPGRVTVTREGVVRPDYGTRRYVSRGDGERRTVSSERRSTASSARTIGRVTSESSRSAATERGAGTRRDASSSRAATGSRGAETGARATTREGIVNGLRDAGAGNARSGATQRSTGAIGGIAGESRREPSAAAPRSTPSGATNLGSTRSRLAAPSRSGADSSRSTAGPTRSTNSSSRGATRSSRSTASSSGATSTSRGTSSSSFGGVSSGRSIAPGNAASSSRGGSARSAPSITGSRSAQPSRSAASSGRSVSSSRSSSSRSGSGTSRTRR